MNADHLALCSSAEWADALARWIIPWALDDVQLGDRTVEFGPGPGLTTDILRTMTDHVVSVELDPELAAALTARMADADDVTVVHGSATDTGLPSGSATSVVCLTMLHHVPGVDFQDALFREARRLVVADGVFAGSDNLDGPDFRALHHDDICVPVDPVTLPRRLRDAGFDDVTVETNEWAVRFVARP